jgi:uncharacterized protein YdaU (DUF1376 family)
MGHKPPHQRQIWRRKSNGQGQTVKNTHIAWFQFYPADFMNDARGLTAQEVGLFTMLLCRLYEESGAIEFNALRLSTYCGMRETTFMKSFNKLIALGKLTLVDNMFSNARAEVEIANRAHRLKLASQAGNSRGKKSQGNQQNFSTDVQRTFNHTDTDTDTDSDSEIDGGVGRGREVEVHDNKPDPSLRERLLAAMNVGPDGITGPGKFLGTQVDMAEAHRWLALPEITVENTCEEIARIMATKRDGPPSRFSYFTRPLQCLSTALTAPPLEAAGSRARASSSAEHPPERIRARLHGDTHEEPLQ